MSEGIDYLKSELREHLRRKVPGLFELLNLLSTMTYGMDCVELFFVYPSKLYRLILDYSRGDARAADVMFRIIFLSPLVAHAGGPELAEVLVKYAKLGDDSAFLESLNEVLRRRSAPRGLHKGGKGPQ